MRQVYYLAKPNYWHSKEYFIIKKTFNSYKIIYPTSYGKKVYNEDVFRIVGEIYLRNTKDALLYDYPEELI